MTTHQPDPAPGAEPERGLVLAVPPKGADADLGELRELARTAGVEPVAELVQHRTRPDARTYAGGSESRTTLSAAVSGTISVCWPSTTTIG